jgi:hypothetical protein
VAVAQSDAICSALQLINFWQDLSIDIPRGRYYLPPNAKLSEETAFARDFDAPRQPAGTHPAWARRLGVALGGPRGLKVLDKLEGVDAFQHRPVLKGMDWLSVAWRAALM